MMCNCLAHSHQLKVNVWGGKWWQRTWTNSATKRTSLALAPVLTTVTPQLLHLPDWCCFIPGMPVTTLHMPITMQSHPTTCQSYPLIQLHTIHTQPHTSHRFNLNYMPCQSHSTTHQSHQTTHQSHPTTLWHQSHPTTCHTIKPRDYAGIVRDVNIQSHQRTLAQSPKTVRKARKLSVCCQKKSFLHIPSAVMFYELAFSLSSSAKKSEQWCLRCNHPFILAKCKTLKMRPSVKWKYVFHKIGMGKRSEALQWLIPYGPMDFNLHYHSGVADNAALLPACMLMVYIWRWCTKPACMLTVYIWRWCTKQTDDYQ